MHPPGTSNGALITEALSTIWLKTPTTAKRTKPRIERVLKWIKDGKPLPQQTAARAEHHQALPFDQVPAFMADLRKQEGYAARALELTILTASRTNEVLAARWQEIDLDNATWTIPAERMKKRREHFIPLSKRAVEILATLPRQGDFIFPDASGEQPSR